MRVVATQFVVINVNDNSEVLECMKLRIVQFVSIPGPCALPFTDANPVGLSDTFLIQYRASSQCRIYKVRNEINKDFSLMACQWAGDPSTLNRARYCFVLKYRCHLVKTLVPNSHFGLYFEEDCLVTEQK